MQYRYGLSVQTFGRIERFRVQGQCVPASFKKTPSFFPKKEGFSRFTARYFTIPFESF